MLDSLSRARCSSRFSLSFVYLGVISGSLVSSSTNSGVVDSGRRILSLFFALTNKMRTTKIKRAGMAIPMYRPMLFRVERPLDDVWRMAVEEPEDCKRDGMTEEDVIDKPKLILETVSKKVEVKAKNESEVVVVVNDTFGSVHVVGLSGSETVVLSLVNMMAVRVSPAFIVLAPGVQLIVSCTEAKEDPNTGGSPTIYPVLLALYIFISPFMSMTWYFR